MKAGNSSIKSLLTNAGVAAGDILMVHSAYSTIKHCFSHPKDLLKDLLDYLGPEGTLLIPTFNFSSWTSGHYFDIFETPSEMGILTETARVMSEGKRTKHPIYSFMVFGKLQNDFCQCDDKEAFGDDSVFAMFYKLNGHILSIGLSFNSSFSLHHYVELKAGITYRRIKDFSGIYVGEDRTPHLKTYSMFVRASLQHKTIISPGLEILQKEGIIPFINFNGTKIDFCRAKTYYKYVFKMVQDQPHLFHQS